MKTFITGIAKTDWLAVYLSRYCDRIINRPLEWCVEQGTAELDRLMKDYDVGIDPYFPLFQDKMIEMFPDARWIIIDAPIEESQIGSKIDPATVKEKLEYLSGKIPLAQKYRAPHNLPNLGQWVVQTIRPDSRVFFTPWDTMMKKMVVTSVSEINASPALAREVEPMRETENNEAMQELLKEMCANTPGAYEVLTEMWNFALLIDHVYDNDGVRKPTILRALKSMFIMLGLNVFYQKNCAAISLAFIPIIAAWEHSNNAGVAKEWGIQLYSSLPALFAYIIGGQSHVDYYMPKLHKLLDIGLQEDEARDLGKK